MRTFAAILFHSFFFLFFTVNLRAQWDTLDLPAPRVNIAAALRVNNRLLVAEPLGIHFSDNAGEFWTRANGSPVLNYALWARQDNIFAARNWNGRDSTFVSSDGGLSFEFWGVIDGTGPTSKVIRGDTMYAVVAGGAGVNTQSVLRFLRGNPDATVLFTCPGFAYNLQIVETGNRLVLLSTDGIRWSDDSGLNWQKSTSTIPINNLAPGYDRLLVHGNILFYHNRVGYLLRSDDGGQSWTDLPFFVNQSSFILDMTTGGDDILIGTRQDPASTPYRTNWRSSDLGQTWTPVYPQVFLMETILQSYDTPAGKRIITNSACYAVSQNDQLWETRNYGLTAEAASHIVKTAPGQWVAADWYKLYTTENQGRTWRLTWYDELSFLDGLDVVGNTVLARVGQPGLLRSDDGGQSWYADVPPVPTVTVQAFCPFDDQSVLAVFLPGELYRYDVPAKTWQWLASVGDVQKLVALNGVIFTEGFNSIRASTDMGQTFTELKQGLPPNFNCYGLFSAGDRLFASDNNNNGLYVSTNLGLSWAFSPGPASDLYLPFINRLAGDGDALVAANNSKVYISDGGGDQWFDSNVTLPGSSGYIEVNFLERISDSIYLCVNRGARTYLLRRSLGSIIFEKLKGRVYEDTNNNQAPDPGEPGIPYALAYTTNGQHYALTDSSGRYTLPFTPPLDSVRLNPPFLLFTSSPPAYSVSQAGDSLDFAVFTDFGCCWRITACLVRVSINDSPCSSSTPA